MPYDPNQPRLPKGDPNGGQWTEEGITTAVEAAKVGAKLKLTPEQLEERLREEEQSMIGLEFEHLKVIDPVTGKLLGEANGDKTTITLDPRTSDLGHKMVNTINTHNHPNSDYPYSMQDIITASRRNAYECRVVGKEHTYSLKPQNFQETRFNFNSWGIDTDWVVSDLLFEHDKIMMEEADKAVGRDYAADIDQLLSQANKEVLVRRAMAKLAKKFGWIYKEYKR